MKLSEIFTEDRIVEAIAPGAKHDVLDEMVRKLVESGALAKDEARDVSRALMRREELGSTGVGKGVAVPHAKHAAVEGVLGVLGRSDDGLEFDSLDGQPVRVLFMLVSSPDCIEPHIEALRKVTTLLRDEDFLSFIARAKDKAELVELIAEAEERLARL